MTNADIIIKMLVWWAKREIFANFPQVKFIKHCGFESRKDIQLIIFRNNVKMSETV